MPIEYSSGSALVGLATMLITLPVPGWIIKHIQGSQREKMQRVGVLAWPISHGTPLIDAFQTDARVQSVTESALHWLLCLSYAKLTFRQ